MRAAWVILIVLMVAVSAGLAIWMARLQGPSPHSPAAQGQGSTPGQGEGSQGRGPQTENAVGGRRAPLRIGLTPERNILELRRRYRALADYLAARLDFQVELVTLNSYETVLKDLAEKRLDAGFLGSFVAVLAMDRLGAKVLVNPVGEDGDGTYQGVIIVADSSPIRSVDDLGRAGPGRTIAMVKYTTAGHLFPVFELVRRRLLGSASVNASNPDRTSPTSAPAGPRMVWVGTHDQVIAEVLAGRVDAGAVKGLRLAAFEKEHPEVRIRRLATSDAVPDNALIVRAGLPDELVGRLKDVLLAMATDPAGRVALKAYGAARFEPCQCRQFEAVFKMSTGLGANWELMGLTGPPPWCSCVGTARPDWSRTPCSAPAGE